MASLWIRVGISGDYVELEEIQQVVDQFKELRITAPFCRVEPWGIANAEYTNFDYISLFYGDDDANPTAPISDEDLKELNSQLKPSEG